MYRILLVDDEPIILAGLKFMIKWEDFDCAIVGTASNGKIALEKMAELQPDIVIADINMPVLSGMDLLERSNKAYPDIVFIMLTNLQDFDLVQKALRLSAVDYLVKSQLEAESLIISLKRAVKEKDKRSPKSPDLLKTMQKAEKENLLKMMINQVFIKQATSPEAAAVLKQEGLLSSYSIIKTGLQPYNFDEIQLEKPSDDSLLHWLIETIINLATITFPQHFVLPDEKNSVYLFIWNNPPQSYEPQITLFKKRFTTVADNIMGQKAVALSTQIFNTENSIPDCIRQLEVLDTTFYLKGEPLLHYNSFPPAEIEPLHLKSVGGKLSSVLETRSIQSCTALFDDIISRISTINHKRKSILWICKDLYETAAKAFATESEACTGFFSNQRNILSSIETLKTRAQVIEFLQFLKQRTLDELNTRASTSTDVLQKAKEYVYNNLDKKVTLQDVAESIFISPSYFSMLFKKEYGQNFINFVNEMKIEKSKELLREGQYRISEISEMLGYENAYYFSRVFRRYTGMSPTEFLKAIEGR